MKRFTAVLVVFIMLLTVLAGCGGRAKSKLTEMNELFIDLGNNYAKAVESCAYHDVYERTDIAAKFNEWKTAVKECSDIVEKQSLLTADEMDAVITKMTELIPQFELIISQYAIPETTSAEDAEETTKK